MVYDYKNNVLYIYEEGRINIVQPYNPITKEEFTSEESALDWLFHHIELSYNAVPTPITLTITPEDEDEMDFVAGEAVEIEADTAFKLKINIPEDCTSDKVSLIVSENDYRKEYSLKIKNGIASKSLILDEVGEYNFEIDLNYQLEDGTNKMVVHKINDFKVIIN